ncbi:MAG: hypothetical protein J1F18_04065 [Lachnospiraceae bacterium]|nr:hypothetical protein [Lachnospiraceae bacterium]
MGGLNKLDKILTGMLLVGIFTFLALACVTNLLHFNYKINADLASDVILGKLIWESKEIVPSTWYIAEEARIICTPNLTALFYGLTHHMTLSAGLSCSVMSILILLSAFFFGKSIGFTVRENLLFGFLCLMIPMDFIILELFYLFASYYAIHIVISFFTLGIYIRTIKEERLNRVFAVVTVLLAFTLGVQGARGVLVLYGPLFGMEVIRHLYRWYCGKEKKKIDAFICLWVVVLLAVSFLGMCFPVSVGQEFSRNIRKGFRKLLTVVLPDMGRAIGFESRFLLERVSAALLLLVAIFLLAELLYRMYRKAEIRPVEWGYLVICSTPAVAAFMVAFTTVESSERYYFQVVFVMAYSAILLFRKANLFGKFKFGMEVGVCLVITLLSVLHIIDIYLPVLRSKEPPVEDSYKVAYYLEENGFRMGYSTFNNANTITVLADGEIRVASVNSVSKMDVCKWMTSTDWYVPNVPFESETAYIIPKSEMDNFEEFLQEHSNDMRFEAQVGRFYIYSSDYNFSRLVD